MRRHIHWLSKIRNSLNQTNTNETPEKKKNTKIVMYVFQFSFLLHRLNTVNSKSSLTSLNKCKFLFDLIPNIIYCIHNYHKTEKVSINEIYVTVMSLLCFGVIKTQQPNGELYLHKLIKSSYQCQVCIINYFWRRILLIDKQAILNRRENKFFWPKNRS